MNYQRIYRQKVRDMAYRGVRVSDAPSTIASDWMDGTAERIKEIMQYYRKIDSAEKRELKYWCQKWGYPTVLKFITAFGLG